MYLKWIGLVLLICSVIAAGIAPEFEVYSRKEIPAFVEGENSPVVNRRVNVPPFNSTEGWIGFNVTLRKEGLLNYQAYGWISSDENIPMDIFMHIVNETGLVDLVFDGFLPEAWERNKVYASAYINGTIRTDSFYFEKLDNCNKYIVLFRNYNPDNKIYTPVYLTIAESWSEAAPLIKVMPQVYFVFLATGVFGTCLIVIGIYLEKKKKKRKRPKN